MSLIEGTDPARKEQSLDLTKFIIACEGHRKWFGLPDPEWERSAPFWLSHAYMLDSGMMPTPQGELVPTWALFPIEFLAGPRRVFVIPSAIVRASEFSQSDLRRFAGMIVDAERMRDELRAADAGIVQAKQIPRAR